MPSLKEFNDKNSLSFVHMNACSLLKNLHVLEHLTQATKTDFDISESRLIQGKSYQLI